MTGEQFADWALHGKKDFSGRQMPDGTDLTELERWEELKTYLNTFPMNASHQFEYATKALNLSGGRFYGLRAPGLSLRYLVAENTDFTSADFTGTNLSYANLSDSRLSGAIIFKSALVKANLSNARLPDVDLRMANLSNANLKGARLPQAKLLKANLSSAKLPHTELPDSDLKKANLTGADFSLSHLEGSDLTDAITSETIFSGADLSRTKHGGTHLWEAYLDGVNLGYSSGVRYRQTVNIGDKNDIITFVLSEGPGNLEDRIIVSTRSFRGALSKFRKHIEDKYRDSKIGIDYLKETDYALERLDP